MASIVEKRRPWSHDDPEEIYELLSIVDEGSTAQVWKGRNKETKEIVAIKIVALNDDIIDELERETNFLKKLSNKYVVNYYGSYYKDEELWLIMELCEGGALHDIMHICALNFDEEQIRAVTCCILLGLDFLHQNKLIHRDIKAKNVLVTKTGGIKLADFGVAAELTDERNKRKTAIGSPHWMAPEVLLSNDYDYGADIWSLGITLIELAEKEPPLADIEPLEVIFRIPNDAAPKLKQKSAWSDKFHRFLERCLTKDAMARPTAHELLSDPFVAKYFKYLDSREHKKPPPIMRKLLTTALPQIEWFREQEQIWRDEQIEKELAEMEGRIEETLGAELGVETAEPPPEPPKTVKSEEKPPSEPKAKKEKSPKDKKKDKSPKSSKKEKKSQKAEKEKRSSKSRNSGKHKKSKSEIAKETKRKSSSRRSVPDMKKQNSFKTLTRADIRKRQSIKKKRQASATSLAQESPESTEKNNETDNKEEQRRESVKPPPDPDAVRALQERLAKLTQKFDADISGLQSKLGAFT